LRQGVEVHQAFENGLDDFLRAAQAVVIAAAVARAGVPQRGRAVHGQHARVHVADAALGLGQVAGVGQRLADVDIDAAHAVDQVGETGEVGHDVVIGPHAEVVFERTGQRVEPAQGVDHVDLHRVQRGRLDPQIARKRDRAGGGIGGVDGHQDDHVGAEAAVVAALVRA